MLEINGNIWDHLNDGFIAIPTNGYINKAGACVMGRGIAYQAKERFPGIEFRIGKAIKNHGNIPIVFYGEPAYLITFPVKHEWHQKADLSLIEISAKILKDLDTAMKIYLPRVGCGNGHLDWKDVKPILENYFGDDDRFIIVEYKFKPYITS